ncbi:probable peroxisomal membrane protein PEX13 [Teleopsis dalmanni]|uniref:probable peroxisomal membrane protein PEX13 n=1 Tax=Teleopsis dalmanni TaxID=139649 RepID=UPI000D32B3C4|nr:probable peroxisomal membrane protein PEX13 [Teleopsis dalmanni]
MDMGPASNYRNAIVNEPLIMPQPVASLAGNNPTMMLPTQFGGNIRALPCPPVPPTPYGNNYNSYNSNNLYGGFGGFGSGFGNSYSYGGYGGGLFGGGYNNFGSNLNPYDPEARFIQLAEASTRPAFDSIQSLVSAIGNIASMLDSTFFALTSSFRAILGVAANFGRLRGVFAQFWQTFAVIRAIRFLYRKMLYWLRISNMDPSSEAFKDAFAEAINNTTGETGAPKVPRKGQSPWPIIAFLSFIFTVPYLIMKMLGTVTNTAQAEARVPSKWIKPIQSYAEYDFVPRDQSELALQVGQKLIIAPKEIQNTLGLLNSGWAIASTDGQNSGLIPINYVKSIQRLQQQPILSHPQSMEKEIRSTDLSEQQQTNKSKNFHVNDEIQNFTPEIENLSTKAFSRPPVQHNINASIPEFDIAPQPIAPPTNLDVISSLGSV